MKAIVAITLALAFLAMTMGDAVAQSRASIRCKNNGYVNGKFYCNVTRAMARATTSR